MCSFIGRYFEWSNLGNTSYKYPELAVGKMLTDISRRHVKVFFLHLETLIIPLLSFHPLFRYVQNSVDTKETYK